MQAHPNRSPRPARPSQEVQCAWVVQVVDAPEERFGVPYTTDQPEAPDGVKRHQAERLAEETGKPCDLWAVRLDQNPPNGREIPGTRTRLAPVTRVPVGTVVRSTAALLAVPSAVDNPLLRSMLEHLLGQMGFTAEQMGLLSQLVLWLHERERTVKALQGKFQQQYGETLDGSLPLPELLEKQVFPYLTLEKPS